MSEKAEEVIAREMRRHVAISDGLAEMIATRIIASLSAAGFQIIPKEQLKNE